MDDLYLINKVKETGDSNAFLQLAAKHSGVFLDVVDRYLPDFFHMQKADLRDEKDTHIYSAIVNYDPNKGMKFSTYLGQTAKWKCLNLRNRGTDKDTVYLEDEGVTEPIFCAPKQEEQIEQIFQYAQDFPNETVKKVIELRYNDGRKALSWEKVAEQLDITPREANKYYQHFVKKAKKDLTD